MTAPGSDVAERVAQIRERIDTAVRARGPGPAVTLVAVSKRHPPAAIAAAHAAGLRDFGENYAQELRDKRSALTFEPDDDARWHFIGALQSNKVRLVLGCALVHTVDRPSLLEVLERRAAPLDLVQDVLVQVNLGAEASKAGVAPEATAALLDRFADLSHVRCRGLMAIPPAGTPEATRPHFAALRRLAQRLSRTTRSGVELAELSMGMSRDYEVAIAEGATVVRVGTAVFGARPPAV
ncbi:MAG: YggS family pyridoxal phosphate-dependent enzyme [Myxococcota bacterium]